MAKIEIPSWAVEPLAWLLYMSFTLFCAYHGFTHSGALPSYNAAMGSLLSGVGILYALARINGRFGIVGVSA